MEKLKNHFNALHINTKFFFISPGFDIAEAKSEIKSVFYTFLFS